VPGERGITGDAGVVEPERPQAGQEDLDRAEQQETQQQPAIGHERGAAGGADLGRAVSLDI
jgi:hypothetical protein